MDFDHLGLRNNQFPKEYFRKFGGDLFIVGSGRCVWDDLEKIGRCPRGDVMTLNDITMHFPYEVKHAYSNHYDQLEKWIGARRLTYNIDILKHSYMNYPGVVKWPFPGNGTSALNAVFVGLALGYDKITLCGIPLDNSGHYFDPPWKETNFEKEVPAKKKLDAIRWWSDAYKHIFNGRVKAVSGRLAHL